MTKKAMLKTLCLLVGLGILFSCSKDDGPGPQSGENQLTLTVSSTTVDEGEEVTFEVTAGGELVDGAQILLDGTAISGYTHSFANPGTYQAIAKKEGYLDSEPLSISVNDTPPDIYVAGYEGNVTEEDVAKYWKNGVPFNLTDGTHLAFASSIYVYQGDVYVAGYRRTTTMPFNYDAFAVYWKNGQEVTLSDGSSSARATDIFVYEDDVYVSGYVVNNGNKVAKYWKNEVEVELLIEFPFGTYSSVANSIFVTETGNVYLAGYDTDASGIKLVATYWKNGAKVSLTDGAYNASAKSIFVTKEGDVYVAGWEDEGQREVKLWKNGAEVSLTNGSLQASAESIFVTEGGDVYVAGYDDSKAMLWKNGMAQPLTNTPFESRANGVFVSDGDVYVAGHENYIAKYWKNGTPVGLDAANGGEATSIFVVGN